MPPESANNAAVTTEQEGDDAFAAAFDEAASGAAPGEEPAAKQPDPASEQGPAGESDTPASDPAPGSAPSAQEAPAGNQASDDDIWAKVPDDIRDTLKGKFTEAETLTKRLKGQISAQDRELNKLRAKPADQSEGGQARPSVKELLGSEAFKTARDEYGEVLTPLETILTGIADELDHVKGQAATFSQASDEQALLEQVGLFEAEHPDWRQFAEHDKWPDFIATQPRHVREAQQRNSAYIVDGAEAADVMTRFKAFLGTPAPAPTPGDQPKQEPDPKRERQLASLQRGVSTSSPAAISGEPDNFDDAFAVAAAKAEKQMAGRRR